MSSIPPEMVVKNRFLGFLIWQSIPSSAIFLLFKTFVYSITTSTSTSSSSSSSRTRNLLFFCAPSIITLFTFFTFHLSQLLFSASLSPVSSPHPHRSAHPFELILDLVRFFLVSGPSTSVSADFHSRAKVSLSFVLFVAASAVSGCLGMVSICWVKSNDFYVEWLIRGLAIGLLYGLVYIYNRRWVLEFPIIQRPPFFSFKMGLP